MIKLWIFLFLLIPNLVLAETANSKTAHKRTAKTNRAPAKTDKAKKTAKDTKTKATSKATVAKPLPKTTVITPKTKPPVKLPEKVIAEPVEVEQEDKPIHEEESTVTEETLPRKKGQRVAERAPRKNIPTRHSLTFGVIFWQEAINATRNNSTIRMQTQSQGLRAAFNWQKFFRQSYFRQYHTAELAVGGLKGRGDTVDISDELRNQLWYAATFTPGFAYRTSPAGEVGLGIPLTYRIINWDLNPDSGLVMDRDSSFSAGITGLYMNRFTTKSSLLLSVTYHHMWAVTQWTIGYEQYF